MLRTVIPALAGCLLVACGGPNEREATTGSSTNVLDADGDGFTIGQGDCDDTDADIHPDALDVVGDDVDNNCDDVDGTDGDRDGQASVGTGGEDCDDTDVDIYLGAEEIGWDTIDQDCDGADRYDFLELAAGEYHTCGIGSDGGIRCWGDDAHGQVSAAPTSGVWEQIDAAKNFTCAVDEAGAVACWGADAEGKTVGMTAGPPAEESYTDVALGFQFGCALTDDNFVRCWGNDDSQQVSLAPENTPADALAAGGEFACIIMRVTGETLCWGNDQADQVTNAPKGEDVVGDIVEYTRIGIGSSHGCAVRVDQGLRCWGDNEYEQANAPSDQGPYSRIASFDDFTCGIISNRELSCWGIDTFGQIDDAPDDFDVVEVEPGVSHACVVRADNGHAECWGRDDFGQATVPW